MVKYFMLLVRKATKVVSNASDDGNESPALKWIKRLQSTVSVLLPKITLQKEFTQLTEFYVARLMHGSHFMNFHLEFTLRKYHEICKCVAKFFR